MDTNNTKEQLMARIKELEKKVAVKQSKKIYFKVSAKGGVSVYGLNTQWPVTLYREQWERFFVVVPELQQFIADNRNLLKEKGEVSGMSAGELAQTA